MEIKKWDIVMADLSGAAFSEQGKERPVLVLQNNIGNKFSPTTIVVPMSTKCKKTNMPTHAFIQVSDTDGMREDSMVLCEQVRTIDKKRILFKIGSLLNPVKMNEVVRANMANFA